MDYVNKGWKSHTHIFPYWNKWILSKVEYDQHVCVCFWYCSCVSAVLGRSSGIIMILHAWMPRACMCKTCVFHMPFQHWLSYKQNTATGNWLVLCERWNPIMKNLRVSHWYTPKCHPTYSPGPWRKILSSNSFPRPTISGLAMELADVAKVGSRVLGGCLKVVFTLWLRWYHVNYFNI